MAKGYRPVDREQPFLMPPDMREWLAADHPVWVLLDVVRLLDTTELHAQFKAGGPGRAGYDPDMMLALLCHAYSLGITSSRQIERLCWQDVAFRVICAQDVPDHTTIWRFTNSCMQVVEKLFTEVLVLCAKAGMVKLETITLDGTKMGVNASKAANRSEEHIRAELERVSAEAVARHKATDAEQNALFGVDVRGDELPEELSNPGKRETRLREALADLRQEREAEQAERDAKAAQHLQRVRDGVSRASRGPASVEVEAAEVRLAKAIARQQAKIDEWARREAEKRAVTGKGLAGRPQPVEEHFSVKRARAALAKAQHKQAPREQRKKAPPVRNITDPDTRLMPTRNGFVQGVNAQNVVSSDQVIIATDVVQDPCDVEQWVPMMDQAEKAADLITSTKAEQAEAAGEVCTCPPSSGDSEDSASPTDGQAANAAQCPIHPNGIGVAVGDAGYLSRRNLTAPGPDRLIATGKRRDVERAAHEAETTPNTSTDADVVLPGDAEPSAEDTEPLPATDAAAESDAEPDPIEAMAQRLKTPEGMEIYRQRGHIAETPHGHIKHNMGIRALTRRGLPRLRAQWRFICAVYNLGRLQKTLRATGQVLPTAA